jgi:hypothetical protein
MVAAYNLPTLQSSDPPLVRTRRVPAVVSVIADPAHGLPDTTFLVAAPRGMAIPRILCRAVSYVAFRR